MKMVKFQGLTLAALALICLFATRPAQAGTVTFLGVINNATDFSPAGLDLGTEGFIFFNWGNTSTANAGAYQNLNNQLPSWMSFQQTQGNPDSGVGDLAYSNGGLVTLTPPSGPAAASGSLNDPQANNNSNNTIRQFTMSPGYPTSYMLSVVVDNTNQVHNPDSKLRPRLDLGGSFNPATAFDGSPDVYQFLMDTAGLNDFLKIQLRSVLGSGDPGIAGFMIDLVPEPASASLLMLGALGLISRRRRR